MTDQEFLSRIRKLARTKRNRPETSRFLLQVAAERARDELAREIEAARAEAATTAPFRAGRDLGWG